MIELKKVLTSYLKTKHSSVYFQRVPENATPPYIVFDITTITSSGQYMDTYFVEIEGWDIPTNKYDTSTITELMESINGDSNLVTPTGLNKRTLTNDKILAMFYLESKTPINNEPKIKRLRYAYQTRVIERR